MKPIVGAIRTLCFVIIGAVPLWATTFNDDVRSALGIAPGMASKITAFVAVLGGIATLVVRQLEDKGKVTSLGRDTTLPPPLPPAAKRDGGHGDMMTIVAVMCAITLVLAIIIYVKIT